MKRKDLFLILGIGLNILFGLISIIGIESFLLRVIIVVIIIGFFIPISYKLLKKEKKVLRRINPLALLLIIFGILGVFSFTFGYEYPKYDSIELFKFNNITFTYGGNYYCEDLDCKIKLDNNSNALVTSFILDISANDVITESNLSINIENRDANLILFINNSIIGAYNSNSFRSGIDIKDNIAKGLNIMILELENPNKKVYIHDGELKFATKVSDSSFWVSIFLSSVAICIGILNLTKSKRKRKRSKR